MNKLNALWEYQTAELRKEALERDIRNTPARARLKKLHGFLTEQQAVITRLTTEVEQKQAVFTRLSEYAGKLEKDIELERSEFENMQKDDECTAEEMTECRENHEKLVAELNMTQRELGEIVKWLETAVKEFKSTRAKAGKAKKEYDQVRAACDEETANSAQALEKEEKLTQEKAALVDAALLEKYMRVKRNHVAPLAKVENNQCGGCNMSLPMVVIKKVINSESLVECDNCGRILYAEQI